MDADLNARLVRIEQDVQEVLRRLAEFHAEPMTLPVPGEREVTLAVSAEAPCQCPQCRATIAVLTDRGVLCPGCANNS